MKSKIITNSKRKVAILIVVLLLSCTAIYLLNSIKTNQIIVASKNSERNAKKVYTSDLSTSPTEEITGDEWPFYNTSLNVLPSTYTTSTGEETTTYDNDTIRKVTLKKYNEKKKEYEVYKGNENEEYSYMLGDVNGDNKANEYDAALIWGYLANEVQFNEIQKRAADVNGDGNIDYNDYLILLYIDGTDYNYYMIDSDTGEYVIDEETGEREYYPSKYLVGNPYFENDLIVSNKDTLENSDTYKDMVFTLSDEEIQELKNNPNTTKASDARVVLRLNLYGYYEEGETKEETLLRKMLADYDMNYKINDADAQYYLDTAAHLDTSFNTYIEKQLKILRSIEDKTYYDTSIIKINSEKSLVPEVKEDGKYKIEITNLKEGKVSEEVQKLKPQKSNYDMSNPLTGTVNMIKYLADFLKYVMEGLKDIASQIEAGTLGVTEEYYFDIDTMAPVCNSVSYSETNLTNKDINVTLTFNELVAMSRDDEYSKEKTLTYSNNTSDSLTFYDLAGNSVTAPIKISNIDKEKPVLKNYEVKRERDKITVTAIFDKEISNADNFNLKMTIGGIRQDGVIEKNISGNQVIFTYDILPTDGGKFEMTLSGKVLDLAENESETISQNIDNDFETEATAVKSGLYYYSFLKNDSLIGFSGKNYFKKDDKITVVKTLISDENNETKYDYIINDTFADNTHMTYMKLDDKANEVEFYDDNIKVGFINIKSANIYFDTMAPTISLKVTVDEPNEKNVYTQGTTLKISAIASEEILSILDLSDIFADGEIYPQINISFSNSGLGKYNYQENSAKGNAKFVEKTILDGKTVWNYIYVIQNNDDGNIIVDYANNNIKIFDNALNSSLLVGAPKDITSGDINISKVKIDDNNNVSYEIYKNNNKLTEFNDATYYKNGDKIKVIAKFNNSLYSSWGSTEKLIDGSTAPALNIKTSENETITINNPQIADRGKTLTYEYNVNNLKDSKLTDMSLNFNTIYAKVGNEFKTVTAGEKGKVDIRNCNLFIYNSNTEIDTGDIKIDTTSPTVKISAKNLDTNTVIENGVTNASKIEYSFKWSEEVSGFTIDDLTIINGTAEELIQDETDKTLYKLIVKNDIADGSNGTIKIIVNRDAVKDVVGYPNERFEYEIRVDRQAAILIGLEAYAESDLNVNSEVDTIKKYYKAGENVTIIATFTENINLVENKVPDLALEFSQSGNAKADVSGKLDGNKLIYTYKLTQGDNGKLSVKGFTGEIVDTAGNKTKVTKRTLDGDTIIADTIAPKLNELKIISPNKENCKENDVITIEAIFDEEVYALENNEIKNVTKETAPIVNIRIGDSENIALTFSRYGTTDGKTDKTKLIYTYEIRAEEKDNQGKVTYKGDNGEVKISEIKNVPDAQICDIAGNTAELKVNQTGNKINVDTIRPYVTNISATVENPSILNTNPYHKEGNDIKITLTFSEKVSSAKIFPEILVGFSEDENVEPTDYNTYSYESDWNVNSTTVEYTYKISDGDNGYLWVKVPENQFADAAGNGNVAKNGTQLKNVFADTKRPTLTILEKTEVSQDNQIITVKATFSEDVYNLNGNSRISLSNDKAPKLVYSFGNGSNQEVNASNVSGPVITYVVKKDSVNDNGTFMPLFVKGNLYDGAGNPYYIEETDTTAPILQGVTITSNADDKYKTVEQDNCKEGTEIYVTAIFDENIAEQNMKLKFKIGEGAEQEISGNINSSNKKEVVFKYTVKKGDNGTFTIIDVLGNTNKDITEEGKDNTFGFVKDKFGNQANIYSFNDITIDGKAVADTIKPYVTSIVAKVGETEIASYTKENNTVLVGRTNANSIKYIVTMSEDILYNHFDRISVTNGNIISVKQTNTNEFTIEVQATTEGVQSLILPEGVTEDKAGNFSEFLRMDGVTNDFTVPTVRFISEYNGGEYVLPTNIGKVEIRPNIEINEDVSKVEYKWDDEEYTQIKDYSSSSDIAIPTKSFESAGNHTLYIKVTDLAGNMAEAYKVYNIYNSEVEFEYNVEYTNKDLEVKFNFETGLTDNRKVLFKANNSNDIVQLNAVGTDGDKIKYSISENGILYAEATDRVGNKVFNQITISNIDKEKPIIGLGTNGGNLVIGTDKEKATIKSIIDVEEENLKSIEYAITTIDTSVENVTPENLKANMELNFTSIENYSEAKIENAVEGTYYMYVIAKDEAGNITILKSNKFIVVNSNELKDEEGNVTYTPTKENTITFERKKSDVYVNFGANLSENQTIALTNDEDGIVYDNYAEILKNTVITATAEDVCGNVVKTTYTVENVEGPKFDVVGNLETWVNTDIELTVVSYEELSALTVNGEDILKNNMKVVIKENGEYTFKATDIYGNSTEKFIKVSNIDKVKPVISKTETKGNNIIITASDELSGICEYAVTKTTEVPVEWSSSNTISTTKDGSFYVWAKDNAGNVTVGENSVVVDTTAPTITFEYMSLTITVGMPIEANIRTNESAKISYSWDNKTWTDSNELNTSIKVSEKSTKPGKYTLYAKATDAYGNTSEVSKVEFSVENIEDIRQPEIIFENLATVQVNGVKYVKVSSNMTKELLTDKMNKTALCGVSPEYKNLTEDGNLKTGSEILLNGETKYIIAVKGDINGDGKAGDFIEDIIALNRYRINGTGLTTAQILAGDINNDGKIDFIDDVMQINRYRIGIISIL